MVFSSAQLRDKQLELYYRSCGLRQVLLQVDAHTTIACWCKRTHTTISSHAEAANDGAEPAAAAAGNTISMKPAVVLLHAFATCGLWHWHRQVKPLQKHFRVFVPDLIFFGKSTTKASSRTEVFQARMIAKAMESLKVSEYSVVGTSYGGFVAFRMAELFPERVQRVVIANSGVCMTPQDNEEVLKRANLQSMADLLLPQSPEAFRCLLSLTMHSNSMARLPSFVLQSMIEWFYTKNRVAQEELLKGLTLGVENSKALPCLQQNVLLIWGDYDGISPSSLAHRLKEHLGENTELVFIEGTSHCAHLESPKQFNSLVERFLVGNSLSLGSQESNSL